MRRSGILPVAVAVAFRRLPLALRGQGSGLPSDRQLARDLLAELIAINTSHGHGKTTSAAEAMARRLLVCGRRRPQLSVKRRTPSSPTSGWAFVFPLLFLLSGHVRPVAAGALEVPLSLLYALSGDEPSSSAQGGIRGRRR